LIDRVSRRCDSQCGVIATHSEPLIKSAPCLVLRGRHEGAGQRVARPLKKFAHRSFRPVCRTNPKAARVVGRLASHSRSMPYFFASLKASITLVFIARSSRKLSCADIGYLS
jgi:hypothetical protein